MTWANSIRTLKQQIEILGSVVGGVLINAFKPFVNTLNKVMAKVISFAKTVADALGTIFGWTFEVNEGGITNDGFEDMSSGIEDVADSAGNAAKNVKDTTDEVKDLKANLQGFDKLNVISLDKEKDKNKTPSTGKGTGGGAGAGAGGVGGLNTALKKAETIFKPFESEIDSLYKLGQYISDALSSAMESIEWDKVYEKARNFGTGLAEFLNGLINPRLFYNVGKTIAGALGSVLNFLDAFADPETGFDFTNFGDSLVAGLVGFLENIPWETALSAAKNWGVGIAKALNAFISPDTFGLVGESIAKALNAAVQFALSLGQEFDFVNLGDSLAEGVNRFFRTFDFKKLAEAINVWVKGLLDTLITFLDKTEWYMIGEKIGEFLAGLDFLEIGKKVGQAIWKALNAGIELFKGMFSKAPIETAILAALVALKVINLTGIGSAIASKFANSIKKSLLSSIKLVLGAGKSIITAITGALKRVLLTPISNFFTSTLIPAITGLFSTLGSVFGLSGKAAVAAGGGIVVAGVITAVAAIKDLWDTSELFRNSVTDAFEKIKKSVSDAFDKISSAIIPMITAFKDLGKSLSDFYKNGPIKAIVELFASLVATIGGAVISTAIDVIADAFAGLVKILTGAAEIVSGVLDALNGIIHLDFEGAISGFKKVGEGILDAFSGILGGIFDIGVDIIAGLLDGILSAISGIGKWIKTNIFDPFIKGFEKVFSISSPSKVMKEQGVFIIQGLINGIKSMISNVVKSVSKIKDEIIKKFNDIKKKFIEKGKEIIEGIKTGITNKWNDFVTFWGKKKDAVVDKFKDIKDKLKEKGKEIIEGIKSGIANSWDGFVTFWTEKKNAVVNKFSDIKDEFLEKGKLIIEGITSGISGAWEAFITFWEEKKSLVISTFNGMKSAFSSKGKLIVDGITAGIESAWKSFTKFFEEKRKLAIGVFNGMKSAFSSKGKLIVDGLKEGISSKWSSFTSFFGGKVKGVVNGVINGINWILKKLNVSESKLLKTWEPTWLAKGSRGLSEDTIGVVNDQKGPTYRELIVPPHGKPFIPKGRNIMLPLEKGTKIMPALETKRFMSGLPHFEGGIGDFLGSAWEKVKNFTGQVWDYITEPKKIIQIAIDKFTNLSGILEPMLSIAKGAVSTIAGGALGFIKKIFDTEAKVDYKPGAGVEQWRGLAAKALQITGQYTPANLSYLLQQMQHESGGNPNAINNWDINAKNGTPSKGLLQVIDPTFQANALPPYNKNIYDPLSNMIAAIRYTVKRYGSLYAGWAARGFKGYKSGIGKIALSDVIPGYASGGFPSSGQLFMARENGISELVGKIGSKTAVTNNEQIVKSVSKGVSDATKKVFETFSKKIIDSTENALESVEKTTETLAKEFNKKSRDSIAQRTNELLERFIEESEEPEETRIELDLGLGKSFRRTQENERDTKNIAEKLLKGAEKEIELPESEEKTFIPTSGLDQYVADMKEWIESMREKAVSGFDGIADDAWGAGEDTAYSYSEGIYDNEDEVDSAVDGIADDVAGGLSDTEYEVQISGGNAISKMAEGMSEKWAGLMEWAKKARAELLEIFSSMGEDMYKTGVDIVSKFLDGMNSLWEKVSETAEKIKTAFQSAQSTASQMAQIQTESKTLEVSDATKEIAKKAGNYQLADFSKTTSFTSNKSSENNFAKVSRKSNVDSVSGELVTGISAGVADAVNKLLIPVLKNDRNLNVRLEGDAGKLFKVMQDQGEKYKTITGKRAFS